MGKALETLQDLVDALPGAIDAAAQEANDNKAMSSLLDSLTYRDTADNTLEVINQAVHSIEERFGENGFTALVELFGAAIEAGKIQVHQESGGPNDSLIRTPALIDRDSIGGFRIESPTGGDSIYITVN